MPLGFPHVNDKSLYYGLVFTNEDRITRIFLKKGNKKGWFHLKLRKDKFPYVSQYNNMPKNGIGERYTHFGKNYDVTKELRTYKKGKRTYRDWFDIYIDGIGIGIGDSTGISHDQLMSDTATGLYYPSSNRIKAGVMIKPTTKSHPMFKLFTASDDKLPTATMLNAKVTKVVPASSVSAKPAPVKPNIVPAKSNNVPAKSNNVPAKSNNVPVKSNNVPPKSNNVPAKPNYSAPIPIGVSSSNIDSMNTNAFSAIVSAKASPNVSAKASPNVPSVQKNLMSADIQSNISVSNAKLNAPAKHLDYDEYGVPFSKNLNYERYN